MVIHVPTVHHYPLGQQRGTPECPIPHPIRSLCTLRTRRRRRLRNTRFPAARYRLTGAGLSPAGSRQLHLTHRNRKFVDSPQEGTGFELPVRGCDEPGFRSFCIALDCSRSARGESCASGGTESSLTLRGREPDSNHQSGAALATELTLSSEPDSVPLL